MAYDQILARRLSTIVTGRRDIHEQKMFGGVGFLLRGNMCFGVYKNYLILRLGEEKARRALSRKNTKPFDITGRAMKGWVMVAPEGTRSPVSLKTWVQQAVAFVLTLPRK